jgi:hypothetical protein
MSQIVDANRFEKKKQIVDANLHNFDSILCGNKPVVKYFRRANVLLPPSQFIRLVRISRLLI